MKQATLTFSIILTCLLSLTIMGCSSPPDAEMAAAEDAITRATQAGADEYSPKLLDKANMYLSEAKTALEAGDFKEALNKADLARMNAEKAEKNSIRMGDHVPGQVSSDDMDE